MTFEKNQPLLIFANSLVHEAFREAAINHVIYGVAAVELIRRARFNLKIAAEKKKDVKTPFECFAKHRPRHKWRG